MDIVKKLRDQGIRVTPQRRAVYTVMQRLCHCSVEEVVTAVMTEYPNITVATVYNILDHFDQKKVISRLSTSKGKLYYDINPEEHHHIITKEDRIVDYDNDELTRLIDNYLSKHPIPDYTIKKVSLHLYETNN